MNKKKNITPIIALIGAFALIIGSIMMDGSIVSFVSIGSFLITVMGSFATLFITFPMKDIKNIKNVIGKLTVEPLNNRTDMIGLFVDLAKKARREGILALEDQIADIDNNFLKRGIQMVIDGIDPDNITEILELEMEALENRHKKGQDIFKSWGEAAPAFGMIGTLIGLILMLSNLSDPSSLGAGMATALVTTFYGTLFQNVIFNPIAANLKVQTEEEVYTLEMMLDGILSIQSGSNPRTIQDKMITYLSPQERLDLNKSENKNINAKTVSANG